jgi:hypothetical protein
MSDNWKAACWSALAAFIGVFGLALVGFLSDVSRWADTGGEFPDVSVLGKAAVSAAAAAVTGLVTWCLSWARRRNLLPGNAPSYPTPEFRIDPES